MIEPNAVSVTAVLAWLAAVNVGEAEAALERTAPRVAIIGPRGVGRGNEMLRRWFGQARAAFRTRAVYARAGAGAVAQSGVWRDLVTNDVRGEADVVTRFRLSGGRVMNSSVTTH